MLSKKGKDYSSKPFELNGGGTEEERGKALDNPGITYASLDIEREAKEDKKSWESTRNGKKQEENGVTQKDGQNTVAEADMSAQGMPDPSLFRRIPMH